MVAPLSIARGTQNKILEAMAAGVPVVTSSAAAGGVDANPGQHFIVADSAADVAEATLELMTNRQRHDELAGAGRARMLSHHTWDMSMRRFDRIIERCVAGSVTARGEAAASASFASVPQGTESGAAKEQQARDEGRAVRTHEIRSPHA
jgi:spore maturation protein CgeB